MNSAALSQSMLYRRYRPGKSIETRIWFKRLAAVLIFLTCYIVAMGNHPAYAESDDALFIDQNGNVGIGTHEPEAKLDVTVTLSASEWCRRAVLSCFPERSTNHLMRKAPVEKTLLTQVGNLQWRKWHARFTFAIYRRCGDRVKAADL